jgi:hypothetical protein
MVFRSFHADKPCGIVSAEQSNRRSAQPRGESSRTAAITENDAGQTTDGCEVCGEISRRRTALRTRSNQEVVRAITTRTRGTSLTMFSFPRRAWERTTGRSASRQGLRHRNAYQLRNAKRCVSTSAGNNKVRARIAVQRVVGNLRVDDDRVAAVAHANRFGLESPTKSRRLARKLHRNESRLLSGFVKRSNSRHPRAGGEPDCQGQLVSRLRGNDVVGNRELHLETFLNQYEPNFGKRCHRPGNQ